MDKLVQEFPEVFNGQVTTMKGERFTISLTDNAVLFCVKAPRAVPFAYREKLKEELELLQNQESLYRSKKLQSGALPSW